MTDLAGRPVSPGRTVRRGEETSNGRLTLMQDWSYQQRWSDEELFFNAKQLSVVKLKEQRSDRWPGLSAYSDTLRGRKLTHVPFSFASANKVSQ